jgi:hypothetical protein
VTLTECDEIQLLGANEYMAGGIGENTVFYGAILPTQQGSVVDNSTLNALFTL